ncbi:hypothetical protein [Paraliobacillus ryukyuensis]|uniref:hypothetical protein n=1 Tax=Paraliobacillus ryukyuensis TaxID=200904 RepID=UPI0009A90398|nr:hypothetical protein [Paraliobacillus ryukyuensis]
MRKRRSHRQPTFRMYITYVVDGKARTINGSLVTGFKRPNPRLISEFEKLIGNQRGVDLVQITNYQIMSRKGVGTWMNYLS